MVPVTVGVAVEVPVDVGVFVDGTTGTGLEGERLRVQDWNNRGNKTQKVNKISRNGFSI